MALVTILAGWYKVRVRMVGENVCPFLVREAILAVGYHILGYSLHIVHRTQPTYRVFNEIVLWLQLPD